MSEFDNSQGGLRREDFHTISVRTSPAVVCITKTRSYPQTVLGLVGMTVEKYIHRRALSSYNIIIKYKANGEEGVIKELSDYFSSSGSAVLLVTAINLFSIKFILNPCTTLYNSM